MERRFEGRVFYKCSNNGVTALAEKSVIKVAEKRLEIMNALGDRLLSVDNLPQWFRPGPIFTFASTERVKNSPWLTGSSDLLECLLEEIRFEDGEIIEGISFFVPFSNGSEIGLHGAEAQKEALSYVTTEEEFESTFGISKDELISRAMEEIFQEARDSR